ncbi:MAG: Flp pilus assembly protein CpaB [Vicinamibacterales bacterium]|jgi:pilus assembly protein CpaB|nr:Flp pilus assembly protein CpaB [Vicinamibacterales bacterium]HJN45340.1 Flp pilus assembly protein CpaB [Vicinamibacterales bacterium]
MRRNAAVIVSLVMGLLALVMMFVYINGRETELLQLSELRDAYVAAVDILPNTVLDESVIQRVRVPSNYLQPAALSTEGEIVGRVAAVPILTGTQIVATLLESGGEPALSFEVPRGRRAVTIAVSDVTGVAGLVRPGNFVDVLGTFEFGRPSGYEGGQVQYEDERTEVRTLLQDVLILSVNQVHRGVRPAPTPAGEAQPAGGEPANVGQGAQGAAIRNVTLLVDPPQVQELVLAQQIGSLALALRSDIDLGQIADLSPLDPLGLLNVEIPVKTRSSPAWRELRGGLSSLSPF